MGNFLNVLIDENNTQSMSLKDYFIEFSLFDKCNFLSVDEIGETNDENYFYFYYHWKYIPDVILLNNGLPISDKLKEKMNINKKLYYVFINDNECDVSDVVETLEMVILNSGLEPNRFFIINANEKINELKIKNNSKINTKNFNVGKYRAVRNFIPYDYTYKKERNHLFMCYNRSLKPHRLSLLANLNKLNLLDSIDWSSLRNYEFKETYMSTTDEEELKNNFVRFFYYPYENLENIDDIYEHVKIVVKDDIKKSIYEINYDFDVPPYHTDWDVSYKSNPFANSYINLTTESHFISNSVVHITEKSFVPLYFSQLPLILASPNHISSLRELHNFDMFDDIINHDYDNEVDNLKRIKKFTDEILRLSKNENYILDFFKNNEDRFLENKKKVIELYSTKWIKDYFLSLINFNL